LSIARLVEEKGLESGIQAVRGLAQEAPKNLFRYDIIGEGPLRARLQRLVDELGLSDRVHLVGAKSQDEVIEALQESDMLFSPSLAEALPVSLMEAQAVGLPVLATQVGSVDQIVENGISGYLVAPGDVEAMRRRLGDLMDRREDRARMGRLGRRHVEENFDIERLNDRLVCIYTELLAA
jgi:colanic acid/amylovoran biosynthesis glycosyltransferase